MDKAAIRAKAKVLAERHNSLDAYNIGAALFWAYREGWNEAVEACLCPDCKGTGDVVTETGMIATCYPCSGSGSRRATEICRLRIEGKGE